MITIELKTGVLITQDKKGNVIHSKSPYSSKHQDFDDPIEESHITKTFRNLFKNLYY